MAETLAVNTNSVSFGWDLQNTTNLGVNAIHSSSVSYSKTFSNGTGAGKAQKLFVDKVTIAGSSTQDYDLSGSLTDLLGQTVVFTNVKTLYIEHQTTTATGVLQVYGNFTQATSGTAQPLLLGGTTPTAKFNIHPAGCLYYCAGTTVAAGFTVTNSSADTITLDNQDASAVVVRIVVLGE